MEEFFRIFSEFDHLTHRAGRPGRHIFVTDFGVGRRRPIGQALAEVFEQIRAEIFGADVLEIAQLGLEFLRAFGFGGELLNDVPEDRFLVDVRRTATGGCPGHSDALHLIEHQVEAVQGECIRGCRPRSSGARGRVPSAADRRPGRTATVTAPRGATVIATVATRCSGGTLFVQDLDLATADAAALFEVSKILFEASLLVGWTQCEERWLQLG